MKKKIYPETILIIKELQVRCKQSFKLREYVKNYINDCLKELKPIQIITLWCLSKGLERRKIKQKRLTPLAAEIKVFKDFLEIHSLFARYGLLVDHFLFLVPSSINPGQIDDSLKKEYQDLLERIAEEIEIDILIDQRSAASTRQNYKIEDSALQREVERKLKIAAKYNIYLTEEEARKQAICSINSKAEEAKELVSDFGDFLLIPVEYVERYAYHNLGMDNFTDRLLPVIVPYPWRLKDEKS